MLKKLSLSALQLSESNPQKFREKYTLPLAYACLTLIGITFLALLSSIFLTDKTLLTKLEPEISRSHPSPKDSIWYILISLISIFIFSYYSVFQIKNKKAPRASLTKMWDTVFFNRAATEFVVLAIILIMMIIISIGIITQLF